MRDAISLKLCVLGLLLSLLGATGVIFVAIGAARGTAIYLVGLCLSPLSLAGAAIGFYGLAKRFSWIGLLTLGLGVFGSLQLATIFGFLWW